MRYLLYGTKRSGRWWLINGSHGREQAEEGSTYTGTEPAGETPKPSDSMEVKAV